MASFYIANTFYTLYCESILHYRSKHKHKKSCFVNARILESFYKKAKKLRKKMKKWQIENLEKSESSESSEKLFLVFEFSILPYCQNRKLGFKNLGKKFPRFPSFRSFRPGPEAILKFCRDRKILALTFLLWENLKRHYFFKSVSIILYNKSMWQFSFISWNYKYDFFSIFSHLMFCD